MSARHVLACAVSAFFITMPDARAETSDTGCKDALCWGILMVPFKAELSANQDVYGSATVGPYVGHKVWNDVTAIGFAGYSQNIGTSTGSNYAFVSYGAGVLMPVTFSKTLEFGLVLGFDHTAKSNNFVYNDKPWISALIGISLD